MKTRMIISLLALFLPMAVFAQEVNRNIIVDQFGYLPNSQKIAVIKNPKVGFDQGQTYIPEKIRSH